MLIPARCSCLAQATQEAEWYLLMVTAFLNNLLAIACICSVAVDDDDIDDEDVADDDDGDVDSCLGCVDGIESVDRERQ